MNVISGFLLNNVEYLIGGVSATFDSNGNDIADSLSTLNTAIENVYPTKPTFDETKEYMLMYTPNAEKTDYEMVWKEYIKSTDVDADDLEY